MWKLTHPIVYEAYSKMQLLFTKWEAKGHMGNISLRTSHIQKTFVQKAKNNTSKGTLWAEKMYLLVSRKR